MGDCPRLRSKEARRASSVQQTLFKSLNVECGEPGPIAHERFVGRHMQGDKRMKTAYAIGAVPFPGRYRLTVQANVGSITGLWRTEIVIPS